MGKEILFENFSIARRWLICGVKDSKWWAKANCTTALRSVLTMKQKRNAGTVVEGAALESPSATISEALAL